MRRDDRRLVPARVVDRPIMFPKPETIAPPQVATLARNGNSLGTSRA